MGRRRYTFLLLQFLLFFFAFTLLIISSTAINSSRLRRVMEGAREVRFHREAIQFMGSESEESKLEGNNQSRYLDIDDYPGSGANNRHSPP